VIAAAAPQRVLIVKPSSLGDVVTGLPVLRALRRAFPDAHLAWLVTPACADILTGETDLDEIIAFDRRRYGRMVRSPRAGGEFVDFCRRLRRRRFDWAIDLQGLFRSALLGWATGAHVRAGFAGTRELAGMFYTHRIPTAAVHTVDRNLELARHLGLDARPEDLALTVSPAGRAAAESLRAEHGLRAGGYLVVAPGARWADKLYPRRRWRAVIEAMASRRPVVLVGAPDERRLCEPLAAGLESVIDLSGRTDLAALAGVMADAAGVICCDSAANFIAPAVGTRFVTLCGPTRPERTGPYGPLGQAVVAEVPCAGCLRRRCRHATCMETIAPGRVIAAAERMLDAADAHPAAPQADRGTNA